MDSERGDSSLKENRYNLNERVTVSPLEAAELLGVSRPIVYKMMHTAGFPVFKIGTKTLIPVKALKEWAEKQIGKNL